MPAGLRSFAITVFAVCAVLSIAGWVYSQQLSISAPLAAAIIAAFLIEAVFYLAPGFEWIREELRRRLSPVRLAGLLVASATLPYLAYSAPSGQFRWSALGMLLLLAGVAGFWYVLLPRGAATDIAFVAVMAIVVLEKLFRLIYLSPDPRLPLEILGQLMWIRLGVAAVLIVRGVEGTGFGFIPNRREWRIGALHYVCFIPFGTALALLSGFARFRIPDAPWWQVMLVAAGTFLGMLWVVALGEEFFFRGLLQQWLSKWLGSSVAGLLIASVLFGLVHLPFRAFPNWRFAAIAAVAGLFYGNAFRKAGGIRASMVAHALVNTTWRVFLA
jgi:membrane protease YdiL (CAAX protease family)